MTNKSLLVTFLPFSFCRFTWQLGANDDKKFRLDRKIGFQNMFYTKRINVIIDSIGPSIILRSIYFCCLLDSSRTNITSATDNIFF